MDSKKKNMTFITNISYSILNVLISDLYRIAAFIFILPEQIRRKNIGTACFDVACITNYENKVQSRFMGMRVWRDFINGLTYRINGTDILARYILINAMTSDDNDILAKKTAAAVDYVAGKGVRHVVFGEALKRPMASMIKTLRDRYPYIVYGIGDMGTAIALLSAVNDAINEGNIKKKSGIVITGHTGFLGSYMKRVLEELNYTNLYLISSKNGDQLTELKDIELIIACANKGSELINYEVIKSISKDRRTVYVVDVCRGKPAFSKKQYLRCIEMGFPVVRRDAGMMFNPNLEYVFPLVARIILRSLRLDLNTIFGCFSEMTALAIYSKENGIEEQLRLNFMNVNDEAMAVVKKALESSFFVPAEKRNFGK